MSVIDTVDTPSLARDDFARVGDYVALLKPRVMSLVVFTALVGMVMAPGHIHPILGAVALFCIALGAGASGALNMWYDADIDSIMVRTRGRPVPSGRISADAALSFGLTLSAASVLTLGLFINVLSAVLLAFTIFFYVVIYTMWLKRSTVQNIVIGGAAGALPPIIGAAVVTGGVTLDSVLLFTIIFLWTPPHFWALALYKSDDYARAGIPMLPVVKGADNTRLQILAYSVVYVLATLTPWLASFLGFSSARVGFIYLGCALIGGALFMLCAVRVYMLREGAVADTAAKQLFAYSILHLLVLFAALLAQTSLIG